jgi:hypothetical protein
MGLRVAPEGERELTQDWLQTSQPRGEGRVYCSTTSQGGKLGGADLQGASGCTHILQEHAIICWLVTTHITSNGMPS